VTATFLHGVETIEKTTGPLPVRLAATSIIALVGTASKYTCATPANCLTNELVQITSAAEAVEQFGTVGLDGYTIPAALDAIFGQGPAIVYVVNVLHATDHDVAVVDEAKTFDTTTETLQLAHAGVTSVVVTNTAGSTTYTVTTDYTVNAVTGVITRVVGGAITSGQSVKVDYTWLDPSLVDAADVVGTASPKTGMQLWSDGGSLFGARPKILIAPGYNVASVVAELITQADALRAIAYSDVASGSSRATALTSRNSGNLFQTASERMVACWPYLKDADEVVQPHSQFRAGLRARVDREFGFWYSESNHEITNTLGPELGVSFVLSDATCDANIVNEQGICTVATGYGLGVRAWGNRSCAYPTSTKLSNFIAVRRTADVIHDSMENAALQFLDQPITKALINAILETGNAFLRDLMGQGAIISGKISYDPSKNTPTTLAAGKLTFDLVFLPSPPAERIVFESYIDINLFSSLSA